jgi:HNH endonuclease
MRLEVFERDAFTCVYCGCSLQVEDCTIDHLVPLARGGLDEMANYVTACASCNQAKAAVPLEVFATQLRLDVAELPVHGDPVVNNPAIPLPIRLIRKRVHDRLRSGKMRATGKSAQKKIEKTYRRDLWQSKVGQALQAEAPELPGQARVMLPEIDTIVKSADERLLLVELAKSANTRNLIGTVLTRESDVVARVESLAGSSKDDALRKRLNQALARYRKAQARGR